MLMARETLAGCAVVVAVAVVAGASGCGSDTKAASSSSPASPNSVPSSTGSTAEAQPSNYTSLLMKPNEMGGDFSAARPPVLNPNGVPGVEQLFANPDNSRRIDDTILIFADPGAAAEQLAPTKATYADKVVGGSWQPADVGAGGSLISGTSPDNSHAVTVLLSTAGRALVSLEFEGAPSDPIDASVAADIGRKQNAAIKSGLPG